jgi:hypothetical protein
MYHLRTPYLQRGRGFGSFFGSVFRHAIPALKMLGGKLLGSPVVQSVGSSLRHSALQGVRQVAADAIAGRNIKQSVGNNLKNFNSSLSEARDLVSRAVRGAAEDGRENDAVPTPALRTATTTQRTPQRRRAAPIRRRAPVKRLRKSVFADDEDEEEWQDEGEGESYGAA